MLESMTQAKIISLIFFYARVGTQAKEKLNLKWKNEKYTRKTNIQYLKCLLNLKNVEDSRYELNNHIHILET